jgi:hypothetical protein
MQLNALYARQTCSCWHNFRIYLQICQYRNSNQHAYHHAPLDTHKSINSAKNVRRTVKHVELTTNTAHLASQVWYFSKPDVLADAPFRTIQAQLQTFASHVGLSAHLALMLHFASTVISIIRLHPIVNV